ncbi:MAG: hypothetical protein JST26_14565 [Bacteroidetes bacterium]|nr:hypothetical protein [Bacteroidota bacterium]
MKKILSIAIFALMLLSGRSFAQTNLSWTIKDDIANGGLKTKTEINSAFSGFSNQNEAIAFYQKLRSNPDVASCEDLGKDANGNYNAKIKMKEMHNKQYYVALALKYGITSITANGVTKAPREWLEKNK